jgi:hypothetical protein
LMQGEAWSIAMTADYHSHLAADYHSVVAAPAKSHDLR